MFAVISLCHGPADVVGFSPRPGRCSATGGSATQIRHRGMFRVERSFSRVLFVPLAVAIGIFLIVHFNIHSFFMDRERLSELLTSYGATSVLLFIVLQIAQVVISPLPGDVTGLIGGYLYGPVMGTLYSTIGLSIGSWIAFVLARFLGFPFVERIIRPSTIRKIRLLPRAQGAGDFLYFLSDPGISQGHPLLHPGPVTHAEAQLPRHLHDGSASRHGDPVAPGQLPAGESGPFLLHPARVDGVDHPGRLFPCGVVVAVPDQEPEAITPCPSPSAATS